ncbi:O-antigen ligase family protein [Acinetobacter courvalinii]|uniref:O-antigen ligase family protein n=1 Tax=Acinetobacter courvalinii TaxID=280147 RepID=UPI0002CFFAF1|nr:O-antigen ligase family protein [Acinetobacter courvalinii]ENX09082.1 hypothetical protein F898_00875 [Acinetobacter courvalinii]
MLYIVFIFLIAHTFGVDFGYLESFYDEYRLLYLLIAFISFLSIFYSKISLSKSTILILTISFFYLVFNLHGFNFFEIQDVTLWISYILIFLSLLRLDYNKYENLLVLLVLISVLPCLFIFISIQNLIKTGIWYDWQSTPGNIRIFDSYLLFIFWLSLYLIKNGVVKRIYWLVVLLVSLALFFSGARSVILSIIFPLTIFWIFNKKDRSFIHNIFFAILGAFSIYQATYLVKYFLFGGVLNSQLTRVSTSRRYEMWAFMYDKWINNPFTGLGGGFLAKIHYDYGHHSHNLFLRLIFEWGILGILIIVFICYRLYMLLKANVDPILKMGVIAIIVDASFSGNFIYPVTSVSCILFLAITFSKVKNDQIKNSFITSKLIIILFGFLYLYLLFNFFGVDFLCSGCSSQDGRSAPFFWEYGSSEHLK